MNKIYLVVITAVVCASVCLGQTAKNQRTAPLVNEPAGSRGILVSETSISGELQKSVDVNDAKVGDQVDLKITKSIRQNGEVVIPKGANLLGRITEVQKRTKQNSGSRIGMIFDRIQGERLSVPISASIVSITGAAAGASVGDSLVSDVSGSSQASANASRSGSSGGLLGGVGSTVGGLVSTTTQTVGTVTDTVGSTANTTTGTVGRSLNGIQISTSTSGSASSSTTLSSANKNLRVEKGATFNLLVTHQP